MTKCFIGAFIAGVSLAMASSAAHAGVTTFVFQNPSADLPVAGADSVGGTCNGIKVSPIDICDSDGSGLTYLKDGLTLVANSASGKGKSALLQDLAPKNSGLAVLTKGEKQSDDQIQLSALESVIIAFSQPVWLKEIDFNAGNDTNCSTFGSEGPCGTFNLIIDGVLLPAFTGLNAIDNMAFALVAGQVFQIVATGPGKSGFTIGSISVVSEVPLPGAAALMMAGLAGLGFAGRRRTSSS
jgi:hypothetical protein